MFNIIKSLTIPLTLGSVVAVCITALGLWGEGPLAERAFDVLTYMVGGIIISLGVTSLRN